LINSRLGLPSAACSGSAFMHHPTQAPLLPKLRGHFAEFLNRGFPARLRILSSPTCVGLRYGRHISSVAAFLASVKSAQFATLIFAPRNDPGFMAERALLSCLPHRLDALNQRCAVPILLCPCFPQSLCSGTGILTCCPSPTPSGLGLGPDLP
jgi:hypothetical protein